ncbi:histone H1 [Telopea speciosissima]|uniref:histone H1 n=1 Tax=Telopea speciosissima TaxID=54955 RepID=UPI001CC447CE|nr:histone H1 [Telopea speciosissima]
MGLRDLFNQQILASTDLPFAVTESTTLAFEGIVRSKASCVLVPFCLRRNLIVISMAGEGETVAVAAELPPVEPSTAEQQEKPEKLVKEKKAKAPKEKKPKSTKASQPAHPPYFQMIKEALLALHDKSGSSPYAIAKHMEDKHKAVLPANFRKILALQLKNCVVKGKLIKIKASYKLSESGKKDNMVKGAKSVTGKTSKVAKPKTGVTAPKVSKTVKKTATPKKKKATKPVKKVAPKKTKRSTPAKPKQPKSIKSPAAKKAKKATAA